MKIRIVTAIALGILVYGNISLCAQTVMDTSGLRNLLKLFDDSMEAGRMKQCERFLDEAVASNKEIKDQRYALKIILKHSWFYYRQGNFESAYELATAADTLAKKQHDDLSLATALNYMGMNVARLGDMGRALPDYQKASDLFEKCRN